jgi:hypothetical protein
MAKHLGFYGALREQKIPPDKSALNALTTNLIIEIDR